VYYLREVASEGAELWRQRDDQDADQPVLDLADVSGICDRAALIFLFRATDKATTGRKAYHPSSSPDGHRYVYVEEFRHLRFGSFPP
jgi:hypothetical protein